MAVQIHRMVAIDGLAPEMIIVGIGYPEDDPAVYTPTYAASRHRDYTPTELAADPGGGGAPAFLAFLRNQLIPLVDRQYRTDPSDRALGGHSLGGLFTGYTLLHDPRLFRRYWLASPSLWWDRQISFSYLKGAPEPARLPATRVFLSVGALEGDVMVEPMRRMAAALKARFPALEVESQIYPKEHHGSVVGGAMSAAFRVLYAQPTVPIAPVDARAYVGRWVGANGSFTIARRNGRLVVRDSVLGFAVTSPLLARARDSLFGASSNIPYLALRDGAGRVIQFKRVGLGADSLFSRGR